MWESDRTKWAIDRYPNNKKEELQTLKSPPRNMLVDKVGFSHRTTAHRRRLHGI